MFDQIKNMIQKMIFHLMDEQKNEDEHKHWCDTQIKSRLNHSKLKSKWLVLGCINADFCD